MARYWVVSPSIGNKGKNSTALRFWIETVLRNHSAYMGYPRGTQMGDLFAEIQPNDVILIAQGSMKNRGANRRLVACGRVQRNFIRRDRRVNDKRLRYGHSQSVTLNPFLPLDEDPACYGLNLTGTSHDGNPQPPSIFKLDPGDLRHGGNQALCTWLDNRLNRAGAQQGNYARNRQTPVTANSVLVDADANSESYEVATRRQVREAERTEQQLVNEFVAALKRRGIVAERLRYSSSEGTFYCDVYVSNRRHLIEAKGSTSRGDIRMAIGQLLDYEQLTRKAGKRKSRLALLVPERPASDMEALLTALKIGVIWKNGRAFSDNCGGALFR